MIEHSVVIFMHNEIKTSLYSFKEIYHSQEYFLSDAPISIHKRNSKSQLGVEKYSLLMHLYHDESTRN